MSDRLKLLSKTDENGFRFTASIIEDNPTVFFAGIEGYLDNNNSGVFTVKFKKAIDDYGKANTIVIDLGKVNYVSSTGIGSFVEILGYFKKKNYRLFICRISDKVRSVFDLLGFTSFFTFINDVAEIPAS